PDGVVALERAAVVVAVRLAQASAVAEAQERFAAISLEELVSEQGDAGDVAERAISFGWDLARPRAVLLASIDPPEDGRIPAPAGRSTRSEEHTSELQSRENLVCRLVLEKKNTGSSTSWRRRPRRVSACTIPTS